LRLGVFLVFGVWDLVFGSQALVFRRVVNRKSEIVNMKDPRFAFRQLLKNPGCAAVTILPLALGLSGSRAVAEDRPLHAPFAIQQHYAARSCYRWPSAAFYQQKAEYGNVP